MSDRYDQLLTSAQAHLARARYPEAHGACMAALRERPQGPAPYAILGEIALRHSTFDKAADLFRRAGQLNPRDAAYAALEARALAGLNRMDAAAVAARRAWNLGPDEAPTLDTLGVIFSRAGEHQLAAAAFRRAVALDPGNAGYQYNLGWAEQFLGDFAASQTAYQAAIRLDPAHDRALSALVRLRKQTPDDNLLAPLQRLFPKLKDPEQQLQIGHALAKTYEDLGQDDLSLQWLIKAKAGRRQKALAGRESREALFEAAGRWPASDAEPTGYPSDAPIFIFGLPRTGTTLVDRILTSHSQVTSAGETMGAAVATRGLSGVGTNHLFDAAILDRLKTVDRARLGQAIVQATRPERSARRYTEKTPLNFLLAGVIATALPNARMICLRRDPVDSCLSNFRQSFAADFSYYDHTYDLTETALYYVRFDRLVAHWRETLRPDRFLEVHYEAVVRDQEAETRRMLAFCGLEWEDACLSFHENTAPVATASAVQVRQPIYQSSIGRAARYGGGLEPMLSVLRDAGLIAE